MKLPFLALSLLCISACYTPSEPIASSAPKPVDAQHAPVFDLSRCADKTVTGTDFVHVCQEISQFNFTYTAETGEVLRTSSLALPNTLSVTEREFPAYLDAAFAQIGLKCKPVGPEHLRVLSIERRAS